MHDCAFLCRHAFRPVLWIELPSLPRVRSRGRVESASDHRASVLAKSRTPYSTHSESTAVVESGDHQTFRVFRYQFFISSSSKPSMDCCMEKVGELGSQASSTSELLAEMNIGQSSSNSHAFSPSWICAICMEKIKVEDTAQIKACEHAYCANCILRWATYKENPWCPQCKCPFSSLLVCKTLDGRPRDYMYEESVCLLLRCNWFQPLALPAAQEAEEVDYPDEYEFYEEYYTTNVRLGNRRWGDSGYVRGGRKEARPVSVRQVLEAGGSSGSKGNEPVKENVGRRAKRAQKRLEAELKLKNKT